VPGDGTLPTTGWVKDEVIADEYLVPMDEDLPPWRYTILVGMYDPTIDERLHIKSGDVKATDSIPLRSIGVEP
jgi:hypothetical protein